MRWSSWSSGIGIGWLGGRSGGSRHWLAIGGLASAFRLGLPLDKAGAPASHLDDGLETRGCVGANFGFALENRLVALESFFRLSQVLVSQPDLIGDRQFPVGPGIELGNAQLNTQGFCIIAFVIELVADFVAGTLLPVGPEIRVGRAALFLLLQEGKHLLKRLVVTPQPLER